MHAGDEARLLSESAASGSQHESNSTNSGLIWCFAAICKNVLMRFLNPAASCCHGKSCRNTRIVFKPIAFCPAQFQVDALGIERIRPATVSSSLIAFAGI